MELRDFMRWPAKHQIIAVPGVAQAQIFGGDSRERQLLIDPLRLRAAGFTLDEVYEAVRGGTELIGGGYLETATQRIVLQAQAPGASPAALAQAVITVRDGAPVRLGDVATVQDGPAPRIGDAMIGGRPGILVETSTQFGANTLEVSYALENRLATLAPPLAGPRGGAARGGDGPAPRIGDAMIGGRPGILVEPSPQLAATPLGVSYALENRLATLAPALAAQGVQYHPALLRPASFIESAIAKLRNSLLVGAVLVVALLLVTLRDWRGALISFSSIPVSLLATVWFLMSRGISLNTMSLGGLVVALGVVVDDAVIDVENITRRRREAPPGTDGRRLLIDASLEVRRPVFYATAAVAVAFLPIFMLSGLQGSFFRPLAMAFMLAVGLSLLVAMSATPALCALLMGRYVPRPEAP